MLEIETKEIKISEKLKNNIFYKEVNMYYQLLHNEFQLYCYLNRPNFVPKNLKV